MSTLYTVQFKRKRFITKYDMKGRVIDTTEEWIEETMRDLPLATARHYVDKTGGMIIAQYDQPHEGKSKHRDRVKFDYQKDDAAKTAKAVESAVPKASRSAVPKHADYSDLVNTLMENEE